MSNSAANLEGYKQYEAFMGRWSRHVADQFLDWLAIPEGLTWLDVGCGAGMLGQSIVESYAPVAVIGVDPKTASIDHARAHVDNTSISFKVGDAQKLPFDNETFDAVVSGLMIKFVPDKLKAVKEMKRVTRNDGVIALYDWDLENNANMTRHFWQAVTDVDASLMNYRATDRPDMRETTRISDIFHQAGLKNIEERSFIFNARFKNFGDYWHPITHNAQNVGKFYQSLTNGQRRGVRDQIKNILPISNDGSITFESSAFAVKGRC